MFVKKRGSMNLLQVPGQESRSPEAAAQGYNYSRRGSLDSQAIADCRKFQAAQRNDLARRGSWDGSDSHRGPETSLPPPLSPLNNLSRHGSLQSLTGTFVGVELIVHNDEDSDTTNYRPSCTETAKLLSFFYALIVIILGLILPIAEALSGTWLESLYGATFLTYITGLGSIFLVYLQFYLLRGCKCCGNNKDKTLKRVLPNDREQSGTSAGVYTVDNGSSAVKNVRSLKRVGKVQSRLSDIKDEHAASIGTIPRILTPESSPAVTRRIQAKTPESSPTSVRRSYAMFARRVEPTGDQESAIGSVDDFVRNDAQEWMDVSKFGSIFSHQGSSLYLRLGALVFGAGNIVYCVLEVQNVMRPRDHCEQSLTYGWTFIPRLIFILLQTFFLFKGSHIRIEKHEPAAWFGLMHLLATNICLWMRTLVYEVLEDSLRQKMPSDSFASNYSDDVHDDVHDVVTTADTHHASDCHALNFVSNYLFPLVLEYSLIAVGTLICIMQTGIGTDKEKKDLTRSFKNLIKVCSLNLLQTGEQEEENEHAEGHAKKQMLSKSHTGIFFGVLLLVLSIVSIVIFHMNYQGLISVVISPACDIILNFCLFFGCVLAFWQTRHLGYIKRPLTGDDVMLLMTMLGSVLLKLSIIIAAGSLVDRNTFDVTLEPLDLCVGLLSCIQTVVQTLLIICSVRRYPLTNEHIKMMPGRGTFAFLVVGNLAIWLLKTMVNAKGLDVQYLEAFYGPIAWLLISNINYPLLLFFTFHSSVCFADIWHVAYTPFNTKLSRRRSLTPTTRTSTMTL